VKCNERIFRLRSPISRTFQVMIVIFEEPVNLVASITKVALICKSDGMQSCENSTAVCSMCVHYPSVQFLLDGKLPVTCSSGCKNLWQGAMLHKNRSCELWVSRSHGCLMTVVRCLICLRTGAKDSRCKQTRPDYACRRTPNLLSTIRRNHRG